jgi:hypothetical protein
MSQVGRQNYGQIVYFACFAHNSDAQLGSCRPLLKFPYWEITSVSFPANIFLEFDKNRREDFPFTSRQNFVSTSSKLGIG